MNKKYLGKAVVELIELSSTSFILFSSIPDGYNVTGSTLENHIFQRLGKLKSFNRIKVLEKWRSQHGDIYKIFKDALISRNWDFEKYPNPDAFISIYKDETNEKLN